MRGISASVTLAISACCSAAVAAEKTKASPHKQCLLSPLLPSPLSVFFPLSSDKKLFRVAAQLQLLAEPLRGGGGGEFVNLMKITFGPPRIFLRGSSLSSLIEATEVRTEDDSLTLSSDTPRLTPIIRIVSAFNLTAGDNGLSHTFLHPI